MTFHGTGLLILILALTCSAQNQGITLASGTSGYIEIAAAADLVPTSGMTVEAWITYDSSNLGAGFNWPTVIRKNPGPGLEVYFLRVDASNTFTNSLRFKIRTTTGQYGAAWAFAAGALLLPTHVAGTYDGTTVALYINGALVSQSPASGPLMDTGGTLRIGKGDDAGVTTETWHGMIDEVRLWPFARTAGEISAAMNQQIGGLATGASTWNLNGNAIDSSGVNHGTVNGAVNFTPSPVVLSNYAYPGAVATGTSTMGCQGNPQIGVGSLPTIGNVSFSVIGSQGPVSGFGLLAITNGILASPLFLGGINIWVDLSSPVVIFLPASTDPFGVSRFQLPLPPDPALLNLNAYAQFAWADNCALLGLSASEALTVTFLL